MKFKKYTILFALGLMLTSCAYKPGYNSAIWQYTTTSINNTNYEINNLRVEKKGYDRLMVMHYKLWPKQTRSDLDTNLPINGLVEATWSVSGINYNQSIDLNKLRILSKKSGSLVFRFNYYDSVDVYVEN